MRGAARHAARAADEEVRVAATEAEGGSTGASLPASLPASPIARQHSWGAATWRDDACAARDGYLDRKRGLLAKDVDARPKCSLHVVQMSKLPFLGRNDSRVGLPTVSFLLFTVTFTRILLTI
jgi:hypothetical protein